MNQAVENAKEEHEEAEEFLKKDKERVVDFNKLCSDYTSKQDDIRNTLEKIGAMEDTDGESSSSSSSTSSSLPVIILESFYLHLYSYIPSYLRYQNMAPLTSMPTTHLLPLLLPNLLHLNQGKTSLILLSI